MRTSARRPRLAFLLTFLAVATASTAAFAQTAKKPAKKKPATPAAETTAAPEPAPAATAPPAAAEPTPTSDASLTAGVTASTTTEAPKTEPAPPSASHDPTESPGQSYKFIGLRYRGTVIPKFMVNLFVNEGATFYSNSIGLEYEVRKDGFSMIPWFAYTEYGTGDTLFYEKGKPDLPQNYSVVNSSLKSFYAGVDLLWSSRIAKGVEFEYGGGAGVGYIFGDLMNNWVYGAPNGPLVGSNGQHYAPCPNTAADPACQPQNHSNATTNKVGGYVEKNWFNGGSIPVFFPHLAIPELGVRFKPARDFAARASIGFSITGFFFGISGAYGLPVKKEVTPSSN